MNFCQPATFRLTLKADTKAYIMLVTEEFCQNLGLSIGPTDLAIHTSVSGLGGLIGQVLERFDLVLALGTKDELRVPLGPGTDMEIVGVSATNRVYQVLLCQSFHHVTGGMVNLLMGRFMYHVNLWNGKDATGIATPEGMQSNDHASARIAQVTVTTKRCRTNEGTSKRTREEDKPPSPVKKIKWILRDQLWPTTGSEAGEEDVYEEMHLSLATPSAPATSQWALMALAMMNFETSYMSVKDADPKLIPEDELRHQWKHKREVGFWPEVLECHQSDGCICWRCAIGCRLELPN
jgi:hypothetical protein